MTDFHGIYTVVGECPCENYRVSEAGGTYYCGETGGYQLRNEIGVTLEHVYYKSFTPA